MCIIVIPACMCRQHVYAWCERRPERAKDQELGRLVSRQTDRERSCCRPIKVVNFKDGHLLSQPPDSQLLSPASRLPVDRLAQQFKAGSGHVT